MMLLKKYNLFLIIIMLILNAVILTAADTSAVVTSDETARCLNCHNPRQEKLVQNWEKSKHALNSVGCYECHQADPTDTAAIKGHFGFNVQLPVSPLRCASCHPDEYASFASSTHAMAYETIRNAEIASITPAVFQSSCALCHGNNLKMENGKPDANHWPNHGIGRINTDGSRGNCVACHSHHEYSLEVARSASTCGRCHSGKTGPAYEAWKGSKHGSNWELAKVHTDYRTTSIKPEKSSLAYPDCFVCHIGETSPDANNSTHNPGERISWKLAAIKSTMREGWGPKRLEMQKVCRSCHGNSQVDLYYRRLDATIMEINHLTEAAANNLASSSHDFYELKGGAISAKTGAAMLGPLQVRDGYDAIQEINSKNNK
jgi:Zn finger protein HypA/HybF involved in hydrogenase expression